VLYFDIGDFSLLPYNTVSQEQRLAELSDWTHSHALNSYFLLQVSLNTHSVALGYLICEHKTHKNPGRQWRVSTEDQQCVEIPVE
jgi:hypothetical protein